jgi:hypothetical protein
MVVEEEGGAKGCGAVGCEMWVCVCVCSVGLRVKAGGSALILLNNGVVPVLM